jgi:hypothetical protein
MKEVFPGVMKTVSPRGGVNTTVDKESELAAIVK